MTYSWDKEELRMMDAHEYPAWYWEAETPDSKRLAFVRESFLREGLPPEKAEEEAQWVVGMNHAFSDLMGGQTTPEHQEAIAEAILAQADPEIIRKLKDCPVEEITLYLHRLRQSWKSPSGEDEPPSR